MWNYLELKHSTISTFYWKSIYIFIFTKDLRFAHHWRRDEYQRHARNYSVVCDQPGVGKQSSATHWKSAVIFVARSIRFIIMQHASTLVSEDVVATTCPDSFLTSELYQCLLTCHHERAGCMKVWSLDQLFTVQEHSLYVKCNSMCHLVQKYLLSIPLTTFANSSRINII